MRKYFIGLGLFLVAVLALSLVLRPGEKEIALMQLEDRSLKAALKQYEILRSKGDHSANVLIPLAQAYQEEGEVDKAIDAMEEFAKYHKNSYEVLQYLGQLYGSMQKPMLYIENMEKRQALRPSATLLRALALHYSFVGEHENEMKTLVRLITAKGYQPREEDYYKVAMYHAIQGRLEEANQVIMGFIRDQNYHVSNETMIMALDTLIHLNRSKEAGDIARDYLAEKRDLDSAIRFSIFFRERRFLDISMSIIDKFKKYPDPDDAWLIEWVAVKSLRNEMDEIMPVLSKRHAAGPMPPTLHETLIDLALKKKDLDLLSHLIAQLDTSSLNTDILMRLSNASLTYDKPALAEKVIRAVDPEFLKNNPIPGGLLTFAATRDIKKLEQLSKLDFSDTPDDYKILLIEIFDRFNFSAVALSLIKTLPLTQILDGYDPAYVAILYAGQNRATEGLRLFDEILQGQLQDPQRAKAESIHALLMIAAGDIAGFDRWLKENSPTPATLEAATYIAGKYNQTALMSRLAAIVYQRDPSQKNRLLLVDALMENKEYAPALDHLEKLSMDNSATRQLFLDALINLTRQRGGTAIQRHVERAKSMLTRLLKDPATTPKDKRDFAYALGEAGDKSTAAELLFALAENAPATSQDVQDLLAIWGERPPPEGLQWIRARTAASIGEEKASWLANLANMKRKDLVIASVTDPNGLSDKAIEIYLDALVATQNKEGLATFLKRELAKPLPLPRLKKMVEMAEWQNMPALAEGGWRRILEANPDDPQALKAVAEVTYNRGDYSESETLLQRYFDSSQGDAQTHYMYAELMWRKKHVEEANKHYEQAKADLSLNPKDNFWDRVMEARILYRKNNVEAAIQIYRELLSKNPGNKVLRADFASLLMEAKRYDEARNVLDSQ